MNSRQIFLRRTALVTALLAWGLALGSCASRPEAEADGGEETPAEHDEHAEDRDEHAEDAGERELIGLTGQELEEFGIEIEVAAGGTLPVELSFPGEVRVNLDHYAHIVPRVSGIVRSVNAAIGDDLRSGSVMAILESRELADAQATYLAGIERLALAQSNAEREERLFKKSISSEQEYLEAQQALAEARISLRSAEQKLHALGFANEYLTRLPQLPESTLIQYSLVAPFAGTVLDKHIVLGEALEANSEAFTFADLSSVWVDLSVYQKDLAMVEEGQSVRITARPGTLEAKGKVDYLRPIVGEETRTGLARIVLPNGEGRWKPGMFVTGTIEVAQVEVSLAVPRDALQLVEDRDVVFVQLAGGFEARPVTTGQSNSTHVEIVEGLAPGERFVARGGFALKAELGKSELGEGHAH